MLKDSSLIRGCLLAFSIELFSFMEVDKSKSCIKLFWFKRYSKFS